MTTETKAAQDDPLDVFVQEALDQGSEQSEVESPQVESAPTQEEPAIEAPASEEKPSDGYQKRINKVTADKYAEKRRADDLQAKLDAINNAPKPEQVKPTLESHDYDEEAFTSANISYQVQQELAKRAQLDKAAIVEAQQQQATAAFNAKVADLGKPDFDDKVNQIPLLPEGVAEALMLSDNGAEIAYHLGEHLDQADAIAGMTPAQAMMEIGRISVNMNTQKQPKLSAAPTPIEPLNSGGALSADVNDEMSMEAWMAKFG